VPAPATDPSPAAARRLTSRGYALLRAGDPEPAIPVFRRAARLSAEDSISYASSLFGLGRSLRLAGRPEEAREVLERRVELPPRTANSQRELAAARVAASAIDER
jgi:tetratricopeptide (TPR) repeat protein